MRGGMSRRSTRSACSSASAISPAIVSSVEQRRLEPERAQVRVDAVVVVRLAFGARVRDVGDLAGHAALARDARDAFGQLFDREHLGELVEDAVLAFTRRVLERDLDAAHRVANVEERARLAAAAVDGQRMAERRLHAEAVQHRAEDVVVVVAVGQRRRERGLLGVRSVDDPLVEVGGAQSPTRGR